MSSQVSNIDPDRLKRVHVKNVRFVKDIYYVVLSDGSEFEWNEWIKMSSEDRKFYLYPL